MPVSKRTRCIASTPNSRRFLLLLSSAVIARMKALTSEDRVDVLIVDDSLYSRNRSKKVELAARVFDHAAHRFVKGFRMLTLGWSDGNSFVPLAFSLLSSEKVENRIQEANPSVDRRTSGYHRRRESMSKATVTLFELLEQAQAMGIQTRVLLFDSWFTFPSTILRAVQHKMTVICMLKALKTLHYLYDGKKVTLPQLYGLLTKRRGRAKILASVVVGIGNDENGKEVQAKIVFVRDRQRSKQWLALLCTDTTMADEEVVRLYGKRWDIEVFFKMVKSHLRLAKELQGRSYDSMIAHTSIVFARYIYLAVKTRNEQDPRTLGRLFLELCDEMSDVRNAEIIHRLLTLLSQAIEQKRRCHHDDLSPFGANH
ncbi:IS4 family transposase [Ferroacidibacillus organovorans]|uniref:Transposase IS701-like DDE domain-containing protein n=1 Tax=Ferroacidibacillus organovorans TaxID=1765683 RepID=A0A161PX23_9BACL|nr:transposase [Ferroacidibacillus organovorans]KYP80335.1 hypothetical protein AYJ22_11680 [Ferroacidibacillus organovorans]OAG93266.1 hypothetical protein AYW79_11600 [Ferroacidibacillus organovorans]OPG15281.1 hypothetical protein B2M26_12510 [Ferroacidibacillus organovorans]